MSTTSLIKKSITEDMTYSHSAAQLACGPYGSVRETSKNIVIAMSFAQKVHMRSNVPELEASRSYTLCTPKLSKAP